MKVKLTASELEILIGNLSPEHLRHVFTYLRAGELGEYPPGKRDARKAYEKLRDMFELKNYANQILEYYITAETRRLILPGAEDDPSFTEASHAMRGRLIAPLMAELPGKTGYTLWTAAGSWTGALELCGLDPLDDDWRLEAAARYAIANASPKLVAWKFRKRFTPECFNELNKICETARELGRYPIAKEIRGEARQVFNTCGLIIWEVLASMGIPAAGAPKRKQKTKTGVEGWKASAQWRFTANKYTSSDRTHQTNSGTKGDD